MAKSMWRNRFWGIQTALGLSRRGFFIPYRHMSGVTETPPPYAALEQLFAGAHDALGETLGQIGALAEDLASACEGPLAGHWDGGYFGPLDTAATYAITRHARPRRIVEVGSGSSTHVLSAAARALDPAPEIRCIDPAPRREIAELGVTWQEGVLSMDQIGLFEALEAGDIAFFDSSHVLFEGTDVDIIQNRILPAIRPGVLVHIHDVFLPDPYPAAWHHRAYTEQLGLGGWLCGSAYELVFASHYAATRMQRETAQALSLLPARGVPGGGSLWLRRRG